MCVDGEEKASARPLRNSVRGPSHSLEREVKRSECTVDVFIVMNHRPWVARQEETRYCARRRSDEIVSRCLRQWTWEPDICNLLSSDMPLIHTYIDVPVAQQSHGDATGAFFSPNELIDASRRVVA